MPNFKKSFKPRIIALILVYGILFTSLGYPAENLRVPMGMRGDRIGTARKIELLKEYIRKKSKGHNLVEIQLPPISEDPYSWGHSVRPILASAIQSGKGIVFIMPQGLDNNNGKHLYNLLSIFSHAAEVIDGLLLNVRGARYPLRELFKNALYHGNKLDITLPIFLYIDLEERVIEVCDLQLEKEISKQVFNLAYSAGFTGFGMGVTNIKKQGWEYFRKPIRDSNSGQVIGMRAHIELVRREALWVVDQTIVIEAGNRTDI